MFKSAILFLVGYLLNKIRAFAPGIVGRVLTALGIGYTTTQFALPNLVQFVKSYVDAVPHELIDLLSYLNVDKGMTMIVSAYAAKRLMKLVLSPLSAIPGVSP